MIGTWDERQVTGEKPYKPSQPYSFNLVWAIRQKSTGAFLPARKNGRGFSFDEPSFGFQRLFKSELSARKALSAWLKGHWRKEWITRERNGWPEDEAYITYSEVEGRDASDMEIVKFRLVEESQS